MARINGKRVHLSHRAIVGYRKSVRIDNKVGPSPHWRELRALYDYVYHGHGYFSSRQYKKDFIWFIRQFAFKEWGGHLNGN